MVQSRSHQGHRIVRSIVVSNIVPRGGGGGVGGEVTRVGRGISSGGHDGRRLDGIPPVIAGFGLETASGGGEGMSEAVRKSAWSNHLRMTMAVTVSSVWAVAQ